MPAAILDSHAFDCFAHKCRVVARERTGIDKALMDGNKIWAVLAARRYFVEGPDSHPAKVVIASLTARELKGQFPSIMVCGEFRYRRLQHVEVRHETAVGPQPDA